MLNHIKNNFLRFVTKDDDSYQRYYRFFVLLLSYLMLIFFNSYKIGIDIFIILFFLSFVDLRKIKNYNFIEQLFEGEEADRKIERTKQQLSMILDYNNLGFIHWEPIDEKLLLLGKAAELCQSKNGQSPKTIEELWHVIYELDRQEIKAAFDKAKEETGQFHFKFRIENSSDGLIWLEMKGNFLSKENKEQPAFLGIVKNVASEKNATQPIHNEERFKELADSVPQLIWVADPNGKIEYYNQRWINYTGVNVGTAVSWSDVVHIEEAEKSSQIWNHSLKNGSEFEVEYRLKSRLEGSYKWFKARGVPIKNDKGEIVRWFGTCTDIDELKTTQQQLGEALKARDQFLSLASHEIRTPLTALRLQSNLLTFGIANKDIKILSEESLKMMSVNVDRQVTRLAKLVDDLLDISRIKLEKFSLDRNASDLNDIICECIERVQGYCYQTEPKFIFLPTDKINVFLDRLRMEQVIQNLLENAIRYGRKNPIEVSVEQHSQTVKIFVKDQGIGIDDVHKDKIFDLYFRAVGDEEESGLGLGLYIAKKIVEAHNGEISVQSKKGEGSIFCVELPY